ncbi:D-amino-acid dehydrogenase [Colwellia chukchiensis]|uniref:D-amino-acid dehydrogenase n=1 Tax=Colwellia chukchiensis TaxID=641665 RepID=A0A1H7J956_9GAMM|nr:FAD-dependent oxidoreductase [Colwellia chukchiensis]SEK70822.1 D-amino-acid dehydrogenase [Colwellia chukchiensis]
MKNNQNSSNPQTKHVAVIGAGIVGVNCALELQSLGFQVTLIDPEGIGEGCSKGNAGHFATEQVFPLAEVNLLWQFPKLLLDPLGPMALSPRYFVKALPWFWQFMTNMLASKRARNTAALQALNKNAIAYYQPLLRAANAEHLLTCNGSLLVFESSNRQDAVAMLEKYQQAGVAVKLLDREQTLLLEPNLSKKINFALYFTEVAHTANPYEICQVLAAQAKQLGMTFLAAKVSHIHYGDDKINLEFCPQHMAQQSSALSEQSFDHLVIATGAWSQSLLAQLGYKLPIEAERGYSLDLSPTTKDSLTRPVASAERKFIITPMAHGLRLAGTVEFAGLKQKANMKRAHMLYKNALHLLDDIPKLAQKNAAEQAGWLGCRPSLPDSLPVIGRAPNHPNIQFALGHQHLGLTLGAITGKLIGQELTNQRPDIDLQPYSISRFN